MPGKKPTWPRFRPAPHDALPDRRPAVDLSDLAGREDAERGHEASARIMAAITAAGR